MYEGVVQDLIDELGRLPGVGPKSAQRIAFHLLQAEPTDVRRLADVLIEVKARVRFCSTCFNVSEDEQCRICRDPRLSDELIREHVRQLPPDVVEGLRSATRRASLRAVEDSLGRAAVHDPALAGALTALAERFDYVAI